MAITANRLYAEMQGIRGKDKYPDEQLEAYLVDKVFPKTAEELTLRLSNVVAAFYGLILEDVGELFGWKEMDAMSRTLFRELGQLKTREALERGVDVPKDSRAPSLVFITAVYSSSPEFNFEFFKYTPEETVMRVFGISRYDRIAKKLDIERHLTWPVITPFFEGAAQEMGIRRRIEIDAKELGEEGRCDYVFRFTLL